MVCTVEEVFFKKNVLLKACNNLTNERETSTWNVPVIYCEIKSLDIEVFWNKKNPDTETSLDMEYNINKKSEKFSNLSWNIMLPYMKHWVSNTETWKEKHVKHRQKSQLNYLLLACTWNIKFQQLIKTHPKKTQKHIKSLPWDIG